MIRKLLECEYHLIEVEMVSQPFECEFIEVEILSKLLECEYHLIEVEMISQLFECENHLSEVEMVS